MLSFVRAWVKVVRALLMVTVMLMVMVTGIGIVTARLRIHAGRAARSVLGSRFCVPLDFGRFLALIRAQSSLRCFACRETAMATVTRARASS
jgi:hypothetical protein